MAQAMLRSTSPVWQRNITKMYLWQALVNFSLWMPIRVVYLQESRGFTLTMVSVLASMALILSAIGEVPTGVLADSMGRRTSLGMGTLLVALGVGLQGWTSSYAGIFATQVLWVTGLALMSGADQALVYDSLKQLGRESEFPKVAGRLLAILQGSQAVASLLGGVLARYSLSLPFYVTGCTLILAFIVLTTVKEPPLNDKASDRKGLLHTIRMLGTTVRDRRLMFLMLFASGCSVMFFILTFTLFQPYSLEKGVHVEWLGVLFALLRGVTVAGSWMAHSVIRRVGEFRLLVAGFVVYCLSLFGLSATQTAFGLIFFALIGLSNSVFRPMLSAVLNRLVSSEVRASILSVQSLIYTILLALAQLGSGIAIDTLGMGRAFLVMAVVFTVLVGGFFVLWRTSRSQSLPQAQAEVGD